MATYVVQKNDYAGLIAQKLTGDARRWTELCAANPQLPKHAQAGCVMYAGKTINLPASWTSGQAAARVASSMPLLPDGRPVAELVTTVSKAAEAATAAAATPTVVTIDRGAAESMQIPMDTITAKPPASEAKTGVSPLVRWSLIGGSIVLVGGFVAWLVLRSGKEEAPSVASNGPIDWLKHKIGLKAEGRPKPNARRRRKRAAKKGGRQ